MDVQKLEEKYKVVCIDGHFFPCTDFETSSIEEFPGITTRTFTMTIYPDDVQPARNVELSVIFTCGRKRIRLDGAYIRSREYDGTELNVEGEATDVSYRKV